MQLVYLQSFMYFYSQSAYEKDFKWGISDAPTFFKKSKKNKG